MSKWTEVLITAVEPTGEVVDIGAAESKKLPPGRRHRYKQALTYTLVDGRTVEGLATGMTKPKLQKAIEDRRLYIEKKRYRAVMNEDGTLSHTLMSLG